MTTLESVTNQLLASKLFPYVPVWESLSATFTGIERYYPELDFNHYIYEAVNRTIETQTELHEHAFIMLVLNAKCFVHNFVCTSSGKVWEPQEQTFTEFMDGCEQLVATPLTDTKERHKQVYEWVISLCNWDLCDWESTSANRNQKYLH